MQYLVRELFEQHGQDLSLTLLAGKEGLRNVISFAKVHPAGLGLAGYLKNFPSNSILLLGNDELEYLHDLDETRQFERLEALFAKGVGAVLVFKGKSLPSSLLDSCDRLQVPLFETDLEAEVIVAQITLLLEEETSSSVNYHGTLVDVFGVGLLMKGEAGVGKSAGALSLIERGHGFISDDIVRIKKQKDGSLEGCGLEISQFHLMIRGAGIVNVAAAFGAGAVRKKKKIDLIALLQTWQESESNQYLEADKSFCKILGSSIPCFQLPVKAGKDIAQLLELAALDYRLKEIGLHTADEFSAKLEKIRSKKTQGISKKA